MRAVTRMAAPLSRRGVAKVMCPACSVACAAPTERSLAGVACAACLLPLAPEPAARAHARALRERADWWDRSRAPGRGYAVVTCPECRVPCVVPIGDALDTVGCAACLQPLGAGPHVRFDLAREAGAEHDECALRGRPEPATARLTPAA